MDHQFLDGLTIAVTASRRASELAHLIESAGGIPYIAPTVGIAPSDNEAIKVEALKFLDEAGLGIDVVIFMTGPGTQLFISRAGELGLDVLARIRSIPFIIARSEKPRSVLTKYGVIDNVLVPKEQTFDGILELLKAKKIIIGKRIAIFWHGGRSVNLLDSLNSFGGTALEFSTYSYDKKLRENGAHLLASLGFGRTVAPDEKKIFSLIKDIVAGGIIDVITFMSPPSVSNLFEIARSKNLDGALRAALNERVIVAAIGPSTSSQLEKEGVRIDVVPEIYKMGRLVDALQSYVREKGTKKRPALRD